MLSNENVPIRKFYLRNGPHLAYQGTSVFVTNIKFHMKKVLHIELTRPKQNGFRAGQRHNVNMFNKSKQTFPKNYGPQHNWDTIIQKYQQSPLFSCTHGAQVLTHHCIQIQQRILGTPNLHKQITWILISLLIHVLVL